MEVEYFCYGIHLLPLKIARNRVKRRDINPAHAEIYKLANNFQKTDLRSLKDVEDRDEGRACFEGEFEELLKT